MKRALAGLATAAIAAAYAATAAYAVGVTGTITGGAALSVTSSASPSFSVTLNGSDQTPTYGLPFTAVDPRGSGAGWNLTITSTQFKDGSGHTLPTTASQITNLTSGCTSGSTCTGPSNSVTWSGLTIPAASTAPAAVKFFDAAANSGLGSVDFNMTVTVTVPANTYAGTYSSTVTLSMITGP
jgi:hypothetical protein